MNIEAPENLIVDNQTFPVSQFSEAVQRLVMIHTAWRNDLNKERLAVAKSESAIRALDAELTQLVATELKEQADAAAAAVEAAGAEATAEETPAA